MDVWTVKHNNRPGGCCSPIPYCGYTRNQLLQMAEKDYSLFRNGERVTISEIKKLK